MNNITEYVICLPTSLCLMLGNQISAYVGADFDLIESITDRSIPLDHRRRIRKEIEKIVNYPYDLLINPPRTVLDYFATITGGMQLFKLRPHCAGRNQYRLPLVSLQRCSFLILGFFTRKDADFTKETCLAEERYKKILTGESTYECLDFEEITRI